MENDGKIKWPNGPDVVTWQLCTPSMEKYFHLSRIFS